MLPIGEEVDRYVVEALLGEGGMARVYRVRHTTLDNAYALKVLTITSPGLNERLVAEGKAQAKLLHPNVLRVIDVIDVHGSPGLIMDYVEGLDLGDWIQEHRPDPQTALQIFGGVAAGVLAAHDAGLVHRDLKPANVLMDRQPDGHYVPKVCDFGLVKAVAGDALRTNTTRAGLPMGTPSYMPPEQIRDASSVDARADVFALGCILYELFAHARAFEGDDPMDIFDRVRAGEHAPLPEAAPPPVRDTIAQCLAVDREQRLATVRDVQTSLAGEGPRPVRALPPDPSLPLPFASRSLPPLLVLGVVAIGGGGLVAVGGFFLSLSLLRAAFTPACDAPTEGWVALAQGGLPRDGADWLARTDAPVLDELGGSTVCLLPAGTRAEVVQVAEPLDPDDPWVRLGTDDMVLGDPEGAPPDDLPVCYGPVAGWAVAKSLFTRPRRGAETWTVRPTQPLLTDRPTEANEWSSEHTEQCMLPSGAEVTVDGDIEQVRGSGTWVPVREVR